MRITTILRFLIYNLLLGALCYCAYQLVGALHSPEGLAGLGIPYISQMDFSVISDFFSNDVTTESSLFFSLVFCIASTLLLSGLGFQLLRLLAIRAESRISTGESILSIFTFLIAMALVIFFSLRISNFTDVKNTVLVILPIPLFAFLYLLKLCNQKRVKRRRADESQLYDLSQYH